MSDDQPFSETERAWIDQRIQAVVADTLAELLDDEDDDLGTCADCGANKQWAMGHSDPICPDCDT